MKKRILVDRWVFHATDLAAAHCRRKGDEATDGADWKMGKYFNELAQSS
ncbi:MAG: hypothetical protein AAF936_06595 [Pseudomonadota bacterium]